ncbi:MucR family transcriptional regulator [Azorhizobium oxalatiphilum]|uniref:MucR family transcriptional regulator n=1 Tax=Azorhizobium oxalatiphilum TaxID=980631 RepID=A0A917FH34_9HYPH|nr:MucR family transcriptional regulator [Azorhizobium oxalatiphilum]GGF82440.1 MucR family transcriptional regulator [Azorhizobium oxalatiphilum]
MSEIDLEKELLLELTTEIVASYVSNNSVAAADLSQLIGAVHGSLSGLSGDAPALAAPVELKPAVPIRKSITPDAIICLEDGKPFKSLKRHLNTAYGLSPDEYRTKWGLPYDYPMVAPNYAAARSEMAKSLGLGRKAAPEPEPVKKVGRPRKSTKV